MESGSNVPEQLEKKRSVLEKWCKKLKMDENSTSIVNWKQLSERTMMAMLGIGGASYLWFQRRTIGGLLKRFKGEDDVPSIEQLRIAREARMQHFQEMKKQRETKKDE